VLNFNGNGRLCSLMVPSIHDACAGGALCDCGKENLNFHDPPIMYDMSSDMYEQSPLTPASFPGFWTEVNATKACAAVSCGVVVAMCGVVVAMCGSCVLIVTVCGSCVLIVTVWQAALAAHYATVGPSQDQMHTLPIEELCPCCNGVNGFDSCDCGYMFDPQFIYP
jgi:hypothetical protein